MPPIVRFAPISGLFGPIFVGIALIGAASAGTAHAEEIPFGDFELISPTFVEEPLPADFDGDGDDDLLVAESDAVVWWRNDATVFTRFVIETQMASSWTAGDLDGDGDVDAIATVLDPPRMLAWFENTAGDGSAWTRHDLGEATWVEVADLDGDGDLDLVGGHFIDNLFLWWENTAGDASAFNIRAIESGSTAAISATVADLDGDGDPDLIGSSKNQEIISWWQNGGAGTAWTRHELITDLEETVSIEAADMDGDGDMDFVTGTRTLVPSNNMRFSWWENTTGDASSFTEHNFLSTLAGGPWSVPYDLDHDGDLDVLMTRSFSGLEWWENKAGDASVFYRHIVDADFGGLFRAHATDLDLDGDLDIVGSGLDRGVVWYRNETLHRTADYPTRQTITSSQPGVRSVTTGDVDGDGRLDVVAGSSSGALSLWRNTAGDGSAWSEVSLAADHFESARVAVADFDGDGDLDVASGSASAGSISWWQNTAGDASAFTERVLATGFPGVADLRAADLDRDGDLDMVGASPQGGILWWENGAPTEGEEGDGTSWHLHTIDTTVAAESVAVVDLDGDGDLDVVGPSFHTDSVHWWENTVGDGSAFTEHAVATDLAGPTIVRVADFDRDGDPDLVASGLDGSEIVTFENDGSGGGWSRSTVDSVWALSLETADLDLDGDPDLLGPDGTSTAGWWAYDRPLAEWLTRPTGEPAGASSMAVGDIDGDGRPDLVATLPDTDTLAWWAYGGGQVLLRTKASEGGNIEPTGAEALALLDIGARHLGREGDDASELASLALLFEEAAADPLSETELGDLVDRVRVFRDDGDLAFDPASDTEIAALDPPYTLVGGVLRLEVPDDTPAARVPWQNPGAPSYVEPTFYLAADLASSLPSGPDTFRVSHLVDATGPDSSRVEMVSRDLPLRLSFAEDTTSRSITVAVVPRLTVTPSSLAFGELPVYDGPSDPLQLSLENTGALDLSIASLGLGGLHAEDFTIIADSGEGLLAPGATRTVFLAFDPTTTGARTASLEIVSNDPNGALLAVPVAGEGFDPDLANALFFDGFETGTLEAWASSVSSRFAEPWFVHAVDSSRQ